MEEEKAYTIPLRDARKAEKQSRAAEAEKLVKNFVKKHMKAEKVLISPGLNQKIWSRGAETPPQKVRVRAVRLPDGSVEVYPME